ncbi:putative gustatory receptor 57a [Hermetia illucens]|uniref:putative gustatory receptor 57a n=1 Tax=Hermetia illucens TaxID=343691 RepID=UPI0018CC77C6|nr:putative gustatory receptor 57a [Hermetia illucens]
MQRNNHIELIECLQKLDITLIKEFRVNMNYHKIFRKNVFLVLLFSIFFSLFSFSYVMDFFSHDMIFVPLIVISYMVSYMALGVSSYAAMNFADLMRIRFRLFLKLLNPEFLKGRYKNEKVRVKKFKILVEKYQDTFYIIKKISEVYGVSLLMVHFHDFTMTTSQVYFLYWKSTNGTADAVEFLNIIFWVFPIIWKSVFLPLYMHLMVNESEACIPLVVNADDHCLRKDTRSIVGTFSVWNRHNNTRISVAGFFNSDLALGFSICSGVASYLLILIQFKMQEDDK